MMEASEQWAWVVFAFVVTFAGLAVFAALIATRIKRARQRLEGRE